MIELLIEIFGEFLFQAFIELLVEYGFRSLAEPFRKRPNAWVAALGYTVLGAALGGLSLLILPAHLVTGNFLRVMNLILTPIAVGLLMWAVGVWRMQRGHPVLRIDQFAYGYLFALSVSLMRFWFAR
jgi:hypothetical protein